MGRGLENWAQWRLYKLKMALKQLKYKRLSRKPKYRMCDPEIKKGLTLKGKMKRVGIVAGFIGAVTIAHYLPDLLIQKTSDKAPVLKQPKTQATENVDQTKLSPEVKELQREYERYFQPPAENGGFYGAPFIQDEKAGIKRTVEHYKGNDISQKEARYQVAIENIKELSEELKATNKEYNIKSPQDLGKMDSWDRMEYYMSFLALNYETQIAKIDGGDRFSDQDKREAYELAKKYRSMFWKGRAADLADFVDGALNANPAAGAIEGKAAAILGVEKGLGKVMANFEKEAAEEFAEGAAREIGEEVAKGVERGIAKEVGEAASKVAAKELSDETFGKAIMDFCSTYRGTFSKKAFNEIDKEAQRGIFTVTKSSNLTEIARSANNVILQVGNRSLGAQHIALRHMADINYIVKGKGELKYIVKGEPLFPTSMKPSELYQVIMKAVEKYPPITYTKKEAIIEFAFPGLVNQTARIVIGNPKISPAGRLVGGRVITSYILR